MDLVFDKRLDLTSVAREFSSPDRYMGGFPFRELVDLLGTPSWYAFAIFAGDKTALVSKSWPFARGGAPSFLPDRHVLIEDLSVFLQGGNHCWYFEQVVPRHLSYFSKDGVQDTFVPAEGGHSALPSIASRVLHLVGLPIMEGVDLFILALNQSRQPLLFDPGKKERFLGKLANSIEEFDGERLLFSMFVPLVESWSAVESRRISRGPRVSGSEDSERPSIEKTYNRSGQVVGTRTLPEHTTIHFPERIQLSLSSGSSAQMSLKDLLHPKAVNDILSLIRVEIGVFAGGLVPGGVVILPGGDVLPDKRTVGLSGALHTVGERSASNWYLSPDLTVLKYWDEELGAFQANGFKEVLEFLMFQHPEDAEGTNYVAPFGDFSKWHANMASKIRMTDILVVDREKDRGWVLLRGLSDERGLEHKLAEIFSGRGVRLDPPLSVNIFAERWEASLP